MPDRQFSLDKFRKNPIVGILRGLTTKEVLEIAPIYLESGFYTLEITMNSPAVLETIAAVAKEFPELNLGAGTVCTLQDLNRALDAGSQFIVTPILDKAVIERCVRKNIPVFPGAFTPTEIYRAWSLGASAVKVFPATNLGPAYIKDVLAPLNKVKLIPTGGVSLQNINAFFEAGAVGVGIGGSLFDKSLIENRDFKGLKTHFDSFRTKIQEQIAT